MKMSGFKHCVIETATIIPESISSSARKFASTAVEAATMWILVETTTYVTSKSVLRCITSRVTSADCVDVIAIPIKTDITYMSGTA